MRKMSDSPVSPAAFSLVEVLWAVSLAGVVFAMGSAAFIRFAGVHYSLATQADLDRQFRAAVNVIADDFRGLSAIEITDDVDGGAPTIMLTLPSIVNAAGELPDRTTVTLTQTDDGRLHRVYEEVSAQGTVLDHSERDLLRDVSDFDVARSGKVRSYDLTLACERVAGGRSYTKSIQTRLTSRN